MVNESVVTGVRMTRAHINKLDTLARQLEVSRNRVISILIEGAEVESRPSVKVSLAKDNSRSASVSQAERATAVSA